MANKQEVDVKELIKGFNNITEAFKDLYTTCCDNSKGDLPVDSTMYLRIPSEYEEMLREILKNLSTYESEIDQSLQDIESFNDNALLKIAKMPEKELMNICASAYRKVLPIK